MAADSFESAMDDLDARLRAAEVIALGRGMEHIRTVATELVPYREGNLSASADLTVHEGTGDHASTVAELYYPGPYSRAQHYRLDYHHTKGQALYLEQPMITEAAKVLKIVSDTLGDVF